MKKRHLYIHIGKPFLWEGRKVVLATEDVTQEHERATKELLPVGGVVSKKVLLDAQTLKEITTLDLGSHVVHQLPGGDGATINEVVESEETLRQLTTVQYKRLMYGEWRKKGKDGDTPER